jgi:hypothetical protein
MRVLFINFYGYTHLQERPIHARIGGVKVMEGNNYD